MRPIDWHSMFIPTMSLVEILIRGTVVYLLLFVFLRILRRDPGALQISDLLVIVIIADATQNAMGSKYESITEGAVLVGVIMFWNYVLDWIAYRIPSFGKLLRAAPLVLIKNGVLNRRHLRREMITIEELMSQLREQGVESVKEVKLACLEGNGRISVVKLDGSDGPGADRSPAAAG
ncbi:MAG TPA: YetF domain-containing protein [Blastocatellia bacterium]|nr:YetF domain-containing protein [Blastocatellia bacterium]